MSRDIRLPDAQNLGFVESLYAEYLRDPARVAEEWRAYFLEAEGSAGGAPSAAHVDAASPARRDARGLDARRQTALGSVQLFAELPGDELARVAAVAEPVHRAPGDRLIRAGETGDTVYVVVDGALRVERGGRLLARLGPGQVVGELAFLDRQPRSADVIADAPTELLLLRADALRGLVEEHGVIARSLLQVLARRLRESNQRQERVDQLIRAYRVRGHAVAAIDPLGRRRTSHPELELGHHGLSEDDLDQPCSAGSLHGAGVISLRGVVERMQEAYCRNVAAQYMHVDDLEVQAWLQRRLEDVESRKRIDREDQLRILTRLTEAELFETFIHAKFLGAKRFSLEGAESLIPLLDMAIEEAAEHGVRHVVLGMAHRGRLNVLANIMGKRPEEIFVEFVDPDPEQQLGKGDVKYHMGFSSRRATRAGHEVQLSLTFNPSHLEFVTAVVQGRVRGKQDRVGDVDRKDVMGLVIHGDAAFAGQGVVQESLNLSGLSGYRTGGTVHVVVNNQIGFTTLPEASRSSPYATDVAKMLEIPILHVNGEQPEAVAQVIQLALDFRETFQRDVIIDMYCYRRHGHNEGDEPRFTQPVMYRWVEKQPSVRERYVDNLVELGGITRAEADGILEERRGLLEDELTRAKERVRRAVEPGLEGEWAGHHGGPEHEADDPETGLPEGRAAELLHATAREPEGFALHPKLRRLLRQRREMADGERPLDWAAGEGLAFASLLAEGTRVRLSGQDAQRGTFSHRHSAWHDQQDGRIHVPFQHLAQDQAPFEVLDSPLSEAGVLGFDFGYSLEWPDALVAWEAQFGDFANGAQVIIDQFVSSSEDKWSRLSGIVLLLPHGFEGQGPEHSSARLERFLTLAADDNIIVVNPTTPAQIFHVLRRQVVRPLRKPLVVMSPKSLLRLPAATSPLDDFTGGRFQRVLADPEPPRRARRVLACSGKIAHDLYEARREAGVDDVGIVRLEQLYPLRPEQLEPALEPHGDAELVWVQEEPLNMGAWFSVRHRADDGLFGDRSIRCVSRPESASPATGSAKAHRLEQERLIEEALGT